MIDFETGPAWELETLAGRKFRRVLGFGSCNDAQLVKPATAMAMSGAPKRYFDNGRDNSSPRGGRGGGGSRGGSSRGGRGGARGGRPQRDDRPKKEAFKPKEGFIAAGLKA